MTAPLYNVSYGALAYVVEHMTPLFIKDDQTPASADAALLTRKQMKLVERNVVTAMRNDLEVPIEYAFHTQTLPIIGKAFLQSMQTICQQDDCHPALRAQITEHLKLAGLEPETILSQNTDIATTIIPQQPQRLFFFDECVNRITGKKHLNKALQSSCSTVDKITDWYISCTEKPEYSNPTPT